MFHIWMHLRKRKQNHLNKSKNDYLKEILDIYREKKQKGKGEQKEISHKSNPKNNR